VNSEKVTKEEKNVTHKETYGAGTRVKVSCCLPFLEN